MKDRISHCTLCLRGFWHTPRSHYDPDLCCECDTSLTEDASMHVLVNHTNHTEQESSQWLTK